jgi:hypothetical protein
MRQGQSGRREKTNVWVAIDITLAVAGVRLCPPLIKGLEDFGHALTGRPVIEWGMNLLFFWLLGLLWFAYREWRLGLVPRPRAA